MSALGAKADIGSVFLWATTASDASGLDEAILSRLSNERVKSVSSNRYCNH